MVTMNRTAGVDPAMLRSGRLDRVWSTDLPDPEERLDILRIHMKKRNVDPDTYGKGLQRVVKATDTYTGAELEEVVVSARNDAYDARMTEWEEAGATGAKPDTASVRPSVEELLSAAAEVTPVADIDKEDIDAIRKYCQENTYPVNADKAVKKTAGRRRRRRVDPITPDIEDN